MKSVRMPSKEESVPGHNTRMRVPESHFVNGHRLTAPVPLSPNDKIEFGVEGKVVFLFESAATTSVTGVLGQAFGESVAPVEWKVGDTILGIYEVTGILGQGGMGKVYRVHHKTRARRPTPNAKVRRSCESITSKTVR